MHKAFPGCDAILSDKMSVWQPAIDLLHVERQTTTFGLILSCCSQSDALCCSQSHRGKRWRTRWIEWHTGVSIQHTGALWWFNSHANYVNQCAKCHRFSKKQHTLIRRYTSPCAHTCTESKQKPHTRNYNPLYLTQLRVSWIIRQRLDNPERNPFHSLSPPANSHFAVSFSVHTLIIKCISGILNSWLSSLPEKKNVSTSWKNNTDFCCVLRSLSEFSHV